MPAPDEPMLMYYCARAREYEKIYAKPERQTDLRAIEAWVRPRFAGKWVLEIACGTGYWTRVLGPVAAYVAAFDAVPETLALARGSNAAANVGFVACNAYSPACSVGSFNAAFAGFWLSHVPAARRREFLRDIGALLEPGSTVVFLDNRYVPGSSTPICDRDTEGNTYQERQLDDGSRHRILKNFPEEAELLDAVAGLCRSARYHAWDHYWALEYVTGSAP